MARVQLNMSEVEFLNSTLRQLLVLEELHNDYIQGNLMKVAVNILGEKEESEEETYVDSFSDLF